MEELIKKMIEKGADGVDFVYFDKFMDSEYPSVIVSYALKSLQKDKNFSYPKTPYRFWKIENGKKVYVNE